MISLFFNHFLTKKPIKCRSPFWNLNPNRATILGIFWEESKIATQNVVAQMFEFELRAAQNCVKFGSNNRHYEVSAKIRTKSSPNFCFACGFSRTACPPAPSCPHDIIITINLLVLILTLLYPISTLCKIPQKSSKIKYMPWAFIQWFMVIVKTIYLTWL